MKMLDEVIFEAPYTPTPWEVDALYYLKEYKELSKMWNDRLDKENSNSALTWEQLKQMEGKPVWIEEIGQRYSSAHWMIHDGIADAYDGDEILYLQPFETKTKYTLGKTWQAFRKERK